jgi:hypothetical protein
MVSIILSFVDSGMDFQIDSTQEIIVPIQELMIYLSLMAESNSWRLSADVWSCSAIRIRLAASKPC